MENQPEAGKPKRIALITGANQGVGLQVAKELVANNVTVLLGSRNFDRGQAAADKSGEGAVPIQLDVTDPASIQAAVARIQTEFGRFDVLVNNAAISRSERNDVAQEDYMASNSASTVPLDEVRAIWETNVFGALTVYQAMLPLLQLSSDARIINVSSGVGSLTLKLILTSPTGTCTARHTPVPRALDHHGPVHDGRARERWH